MIFILIKPRIKKYLKFDFINIIFNINQDLVLISNLKNKMNNEWSEYVKKELNSLKNYFSLVKTRLNLLS